MLRADMDLQEHPSPHDSKKITGKSDGNFRQPITTFSVIHFDLNLPGPFELGVHIFEQSESELRSKPLSDRFELA